MDSKSKLQDPIGIVEQHVIQNLVLEAQSQEIVYGLLHRAEGVRGAEQKLVAHEAVRRLDIEATSGQEEIHVGT